MYIELGRGRRKESVTFEGQRVDVNSRASFLFSSVTVTDDLEESNNSRAFLDNVGTIKVQIHRISVAPRARRYVHGPPAALPQSKVVHETSKKGMLSHTAGLGPAVPIKPQRDSAQHHNYVDGRDQPIHTFKFYYRSRDLLELQSIIPANRVEVAEEVLDEKPAVAGPGPKSKKRQTTINIDSSDDEAPARLKKVKAEAGVKLEKGLKQEKDGKPKKPTVIVIDDDSD